MSNYESDSHPMDDFHTYSQSGGCEFENSRTTLILDMFKKLYLVCLNDGIHTKITAPRVQTPSPYLWPSPNTNILFIHNVPINLPIHIFDLTRYISSFSDSVLESKENEIEKKY
jgi:hypothetical protein